MNPTDYNLIAFRAITSFTNDLSENFGKHNHELKLYDRLIGKTSISHDKAIKKHIDIFREFCIANRDHLVLKDFKNFVTTKIEYSEKVFIDFSKIFNKADSENSEAIWKHLLTISALLDPAGNAKEILKKSKEKSEANFLTDIINKVESHVKPDANPMEAVSSIVSSGVFTELLTGMNDGIQNGSLDLGKLMGAVQTMCTGLSGNQGSSSAPAGNNDMGNMLNNLMAGMNNPSSGGNPGIPDLSQLTNMLGPMLSGLNQPQKVSVSEVKPDDVE